MQHHYRQLGISALKIAVVLALIGALAPACADSSEAASAATAVLIDGTTTYKTGEPCPHAIGQIQFKNATKASATYTVTFPQNSVFMIESGNTGTVNAGSESIGVVKYDCANITTPASATEAITVSWQYTDGQGQPQTRQEQITLKVTVE